MVEVPSSGSGQHRDRYDVAIIGGGFYGCCLSLYYREQGKSVILLEEAGELLSRASFVNQARVHNGYHYPRSLLTAIRSRINFPRFVEDFEASIVKDFDKVYAIGRNNSKVSAYQFQKFCEQVGAPIEQADKDIEALFAKDHIEAVFAVTECAFDAHRLRDVLISRMAAEGVEVRTGRSVRLIESAASGLKIELNDGGTLRAESVTVCTYSRINRILFDSGLPLLPMKHEITEVALIEPASELAGLGVTVMDGPFFSSMPFPARDAFSLTHVRYTPHGSWLDLESYRDPYAQLASNPPESQAIYMLKDAQRFLPAIASSRMIGSLYEIKTTLPQNEVDDGRPILYRPNYGMKGLSIVMGGKIDNIYDILHAIQAHESGTENSKLTGSNAT